MKTFSRLVSKDEVTGLVSAADGGAYTDTIDFSDIGDVGFNEPRSVYMSDRPDSLFFHIMW
jgi:hypothetical protein